MKSFVKVMKEDKGARSIFLILAIMIFLGIACLVFAIFR